MFSFFKETQFGAEDPRIALQNLIKLNKSVSCDMSIQIQSEVP